MMSRSQKGEDACWVKQLIAIGSVWRLWGRAGGQSQAHLTYSCCAMMSKAHRLPLQSCKCSGGCMCYISMRLAQHAVHAALIPAHLMLPQ